MMMRLHIRKKRRFRFNKKEHVTLWGYSVKNCVTNTSSTSSFICTFPSVLDQKKPGLRLLGHQGPRYVSTAALTECWLCTGHRKPPDIHIRKYLTSISFYGWGSYAWQSQTRPWVFLTLRVLGQLTEWCDFDENLFNMYSESITMWGILDILEEYQKRQ